MKLVTRSSLLARVVFAVSWLSLAGIGGSRRREPVLLVHLCAGCWLLAAGCFLSRLRPLPLPLWRLASWPASQSGRLASASILFVCPMCIMCVIFASAECPAPKTEMQGDKSSDGHSTACPQTNPLNVGLQTAWRSNPSTGRPTSRHNRAQHQGRSLVRPIGCSLQYLSLDS